MIRPYRKNPRFWEYKGKPVLLLGGSVEDNLFQINGLKEHLDLLHSVGGNYIRCTMSSRDEGDVWPHALDEKTGLYDLNKFNQEYWDKFDLLLQMTAARDIIVQIEIWDRFDFSREPWQKNPFNPKRNCNYTCEESSLAEDYPNHPGTNEQPFFFTVPQANDIPLLRHHQEAFVRKLLSITFQYDHVLYCMDNETSGIVEWGAYWADFILTLAQETNKEVYLTEMWDQWDIKDKMHDATFSHPERYGFVDISQNNHLNGDEHWANMHWRRESTSDDPRPMNMVKIYGADGNKFGHSNDDAIARFWRGLLGGMASLRFHRPPSGLGLSELAQANLKSARLLLKKMDFQQCTPDAGHNFFKARDEGGAYLSQYGNQIVIYFPKLSKVILPTPIKKVRWLNVLTGEWTEGPASVRSLTPPDEAHWIALIEEN